MSRELVLTFELRKPLRPVTGASVLRDVEELYWSSVRELAFDPRELAVDPLVIDLSAASERPGWIPPELPPDKWDPAVDHALRFAPILSSARVGSFEIAIELPPAVWAGAITAFTAALGYVFGVPQKFQKARKDFWGNKLDADQKKQEWLDWKRKQQDATGVRLAKARVRRRWFR